MLKDIYPEYRDSVDFYALNIDPGEDLSSLVRFRDAHGHPWPVAQASAEMLPQYNLVVQPTMLFIDGDGVIVFRGGYGGNSLAIAETWHHLFQELSGA